MFTLINTTYYPSYLDYELSGGIPSEIENLVHLTYLKIVGNELGGEIPSEIGNLINLSSFDISNNNFSILGLGIYGNVDMFKYPSQTYIDGNS